MRFGKVLAAAFVAASLSSTPVMAAPNPASALSVARAGAAMNEESSLAGSSILILIVVIAAVVGGAAAASGGGNSDDLPVSG